jgi:hypothetical protein
VRVALSRHVSVESARGAAVRFDMWQRCQSAWKMMATIFINVSIANALSGCAISPEGIRPTNIIEEF